MNRLQTAWIFEAIIKIMIVLISISFSCVYATNYSVGGVTGWDLSSDMQNWSSSTTFNTGDNLVFAYGSIHSVLEVDEGAYATCNTSSPISINNGGQTVISLDTPGTRYFICGTSGHCGLGLRVQVDVLLAGNSSAGADGRGRGGGGGGGRRIPPSFPKRSPPPSKRSPPPPPSQSSDEPPPSPEHEIPDIDIPTLGPSSKEGSAAMKILHEYLVITSLMRSLMILMISMIWV